MTEHPTRPPEEPEEFLRAWSLEEDMELLEGHIDRLERKRATTEGMFLGLCFITVIFALWAIGAQLYGPAICFAFIFLVALNGVWLGRE